MARRRRRSNNIIGPSFFAPTLFHQNPGRRAGVNTNTLLLLGAAGVGLWWLSRPEAPAGPPGGPPTNRFQQILKDIFTPRPIGAGPAPPGVVGPPAVRPGADTGIPVKAIGDILTKIIGLFPPIFGPGPTTTAPPFEPPPHDIPPFVPQPPSEPPAPPIIPDIPPFVPLPPSEPVGPPLPSDPPVMPGVDPAPGVPDIGFSFFSFSRF
jgi:hypothetical protein